MEDPSPMMRAISKWHAALSGVQVVAVREAVEYLSQAGVTVATGFSGCEVLRKVVDELESYWAD